MKSLINIIAILLIVFGIGVLSYQGFTYTKQEKIAQLGELQITAEKKETVYFPPMLGGLSIVVGVLVLAIGRMKK